MPVFENERGTFLFNSKDLCMIEHVPELLEAGIDSFKVEGRMKNALYVATVARTYRRAIDSCKRSVEQYREGMEGYREEIRKCTCREYTTGFYYGKPGDEAQIYGESTYLKNYTYLGTVEEIDEKGRCKIWQKNKFSVGEKIEIMKPDGRDLAVTVRGIWDEAGCAKESAPHAREILWVALDRAPKPYDILRRSEE